MGCATHPGHHAAFDQFGGYCFFNNAAIAAQHALDAGRRRVAVLDVDFHHGDGTQQILYARNDVLFASLHGDPDSDLSLLSTATRDETGTGEGQGFNLNYPMAPGTSVATWMQTLEQALIASGSP